MKTKWCEHIKWSKFYGYWIFNETPIPSNWRFCPICSMERPSKEKDERDKSDYPG